MRNHAETVLPKQYTDPISPVVTANHPIRVRSPATRTALLFLGVLVVLLSPIVGVLPGPGGIFVFAAGLALILQNSQSAKRRFVEIKRRWPRVGHYADLGLRRASALRRRERDRVPRDAEGKQSRIRLLWLTIRDSIRGRTD